MNVFVGITGASGAPYARRLVQVLQQLDITVGACFSKASVQVSGQELYGDLRMDPEEVLTRWKLETGIADEHLYDAHDFGSPYASGSARWDAAVIVPCSMDTLATIASGAGSNLLHRAASVALKEDRKLSYGQTPLSTIHLENMLRTKSRRIFASDASVLSEIQNRWMTYVVAKICNLLDIDQSMLPVAPQIKSRVDKVQYSYA